MQELLRSCAVYNRVSDLQSQHQSVRRFTRNIDHSLMLLTSVQHALVQCYTEGCLLVLQHTRHLASKNLSLKLQTSDEASEKVLCEMKQQVARPHVVGHV